MRFYVNITGNLATGCTTLASRLGRAYGWHVVLERDSESPFLTRFYEEPNRWAFHNQAYFMIQSFEQHMQLSDAALADATIVQDYTVFDPLEVYARAMAEFGALDTEEFEVLERFFRLFNRSIRVPDVLVFLTAPLQEIWNRVRERARPSERAVDIRYLEVLQRQYDRLLRSWTKSPIVVVDTKLVDFTADDQALRRIGADIQSYLSTLIQARYRN